MPRLFCDERKRVVLATNAQRHDEMLVAAASLLMCANLRGVRGYGQALPARQAKPSMAPEKQRHRHAKKPNLSTFQTSPPFRPFHRFHPSTRKAIFVINPNQMAADTSLFLKNMWYMAFHSSFLKKGKMMAREILGEKIVFGRDSKGEVFALRDNCAHRGVPLSEGWFENDTLQCCYHGWQFGTNGVCTNIPAIPKGGKVDCSKIRVFRYPVREISDTIWIYIPEKKIDFTVKPLIPPPDLILDPSKKFLHVETVTLPANIDHSVIGLIDPAHVTFVHQSWYWRSAKKLKLKEKIFEPTALGFKMLRHSPSTNSKGYSVLNGGSSTEITFEIPGNRYEHILVGEKNEVISITILTPINDHKTELHHIFYSTLPATRWLWWPLKKLGKKFIGQDLDVFIKLNKGLQSNPTLMLIGEPDAQAKWYFEIKRLWQKAQQDNVPFVNPVKGQTLHWVT